MNMQAFCSKTGKRCYHIKLFLSLMVSWLIMLFLICYLMMCSLSKGYSGGGGVGTSAHPHRCLAPLLWFGMHDLWTAGVPLCQLQDWTLAGADKLSQVSTLLMGSRPQPRVDGQPLRILQAQGHAGYLDCRRAGGLLLLSCPLSMLWCHQPRGGVAVIIPCFELLWCVCVWPWPPHLQPY